MAEKEDNKSKRFPNTKKTPDTKNISRCRIEHVHMKSPYTMKDKKYSIG